MQGAADSHTDHSHSHEHERGSGGWTAPPRAHSHEHAHSHDDAHDHEHSHEHAHDHEDSYAGHAHRHDHGHEHAHGHDHSHTHSHEHGHAHDFAIRFQPGDAEQHRASLEAGAGRGKLLLLDTASGIAGDMTIAALVDLGVPLSVVERAVSALPLSGYELRARPVLVGVLGATHFEVVVKSAQPARSYAQITELLEASELAPPVKARAQRAFRILAEAEAAAHRVAVADVHFHEVGAVDSIVDIVGASACFEHLGAEVWVTPLPLGRGFVRCQHGRIPLPAPATLTCLRGFHTVDAGIEGELVTPTGAALVAATARPVRGWPGGTPLRSGWGAGTRELTDRPNALRAVLLERAEAEAEHAVELIEANVDDLTGELAGHALEQLLAAGALDAWITAVTMKKGRPGWVIAALARPALADRVSAALIRETSTLGVRRRGASRVERPRRAERVTTRYGEVGVKIGEGPFGAPQIKPEFEDCRRLAAAAGVSVREVIAEALGAARALTAP
ncbi:MAG: nickel pincer cofactor biosynthesis protein LarC [Polyangiaceae bacterium]|nr:nickel pincer cofactor biosynthesis protein LarC [Polyangiaceae bacterium]MCW5790776.1 nickel pincer cofactor biosynthesis protein LarC [Polyangiaceae bacterium]